MCSVALLLLLCARCHQPKFSIPSVQYNCFTCLSGSHDRERRSDFVQCTVRRVVFETEARSERVCGVSLYCLSISRENTFPRNFAPIYCIFSFLVRGRLRSFPQSCRFWSQERDAIHDSRVAPPLDLHTSRERQGERERVRHKERERQSESERGRERRERERER